MESTFIENQVPVIIKKIRRLLWNRKFNCSIRATSPYSEPDEPISHPTTLHYTLILIPNSYQRQRSCKTFRNMLVFT